MVRTYSDLITLVRNWANRDSEVLTDAIIQDCIRYAADKAYRSLRVAPLEHTVVYDNSTMLTAASTSTNNRFASVTELAIPPDLIEFIQIRGVDSAGRTTRMFNEKADVRTFNDLYAEKYSDLAVWTRQGNCILISPAVGQSGGNYGATGVLQEEAIELYYYRRLPSFYARYEATLANAERNLLIKLNASLTENQSDSTYPDYPEATEGPLPTVTGNLMTSDISTIDLIETPVLQNGIFVPGYRVPLENEAGATTFFGRLVPNWLRDQNERVVLMGALAEVFFYLQEDEQAAKYAQLFAAEIQELNNEDQMRNASGGNVQMNFNGRGLI